MKQKIQKMKQGGVAIYKTAKGDAQIEVRLEKETVWLDAHQIAAIFGVNRPAIVKHINNIYKTGELNSALTCSKLEQVAADGKRRKMNLYNLDMIISVGYRVNSKTATQFRIWATKALKEYLIKGYLINEKHLLGTRAQFQELKIAVAFLQEKSQKELLAGQAQEILNLLSSYAKTLTILEQYDKGRLGEPSGKRTRFVLGYADCQKIISELKKELVAKKEAGDLFGLERGGLFEGIVKNLYQTFGGRELYSTIEEKAAHLIYLTIKDHPFSDGNKRVGSFLFVYFLDKVGCLYRKSGEKKINDNALVALALLIAESQPKEKDIIIKIVTNLIAD